MLPTDSRSRRILFPLAASLPFILASPHPNQQEHLKPTNTLLPVFDTQEHVPIPAFITNAPIPRPDALHDILRRQEGDELGCRNLCGADGGTTYSCAYFGSGYGICCPTSTFCEPRTACVAYTEHSASGLSGPSINSAQTMLCGSDGPVCYTGTWEHGVSFGEDLTMAHCVGAGRLSSEYFGCTRWTTSAYCNGETTTSDDPSSESTSTPSETSPSDTTSSETSSAETSDPTSDELDPPIETDDPDADSSANKEDEGSGGLSTGAVAGIAVGTGLGCVALAIIAFFVWRHSRNPSPENNNNNNNNPPAALIAGPGNNNNNNNHQPPANLQPPGAAPAYYPPGQHDPQMAYVPPTSPMMGYAGHPHQQPLMAGYNYPQGQNNTNSYYEPGPGQFGQSPVMNPVDVQTKTVYNELPAENR